MGMQSTDNGYTLFDHFRAPITCRMQASASAASQTLACVPRLAMLGRYVYASVFDETGTSMRAEARKLTIPIHVQLCRKCIQLSYTYTEVYCLCAGKS